MENIDSNLIRDIIDKELIVTRVQPIISAKRKTTMAVEALSRGIHPATGETIPPDKLFYAAAKNGLTLELDRLCRKKSLQTYSELRKNNSDIVLFINFDVSVLDKNVNGSNHLLNSVKELGIEPSSILIEIIESKVENVDALRKFVSTYRSAGFLIGLDDIGAGHSNLDRIAMIKPDIIKMDRSIIDGIDRDYHKQEVFRSMTGLARNIGAMIVAEGVENLDEAVTTLDLGANLFQGFFFSKPINPEEFTNGDGLDKKAGEVAECYKRNTIADITEKRNKARIYDRTIREIIEKLTLARLDYFKNILTSTIEKHQEIEYLYILDKNGIQITETIGNLCLINQSRSKIFYPDTIGADQSMKDYYLFLSAGLKKFTTGEYISLASGKISLTISAIFKHHSGEDFILCMDIVSK